MIYLTLKIQKYINKITFFALLQFRDNKTFTCELVR